MSEYGGRDERKRRKEKKVSQDTKSQLSRDYTTQSERARGIKLVVCSIAWSDLTYPASYPAVLPPFFSRKKPLVARKIKICISIMLLLPGIELGDGSRVRLSVCYQVLSENGLPSNLRSHSLY